MARRLSNEAAMRAGLRGVRTHAWPPKGKRVIKGRPHREWNPIMRQMVTVHPETLVPRRQAKTRRKRA